jgi:hypothetical protein
METIMLKKTTVKHQLADIALDISWAKIAQRYFGKSTSWLYHKLDGISGHGAVGGFTYTEKQQLKESLFDLSDRLRKAAENIE